MKRKILAMLLVAVMMVSFAFSAMAAYSNTDTPNPTSNDWSAQVRYYYTYLYGGYVTEWAGSANLSKLDIGNGQFFTGWYLDPDGAYHYFDSTGKAVTNSWIDGTYYVTDTGIMATSQWIGNYYVGSNGKYIPNAQASGWGKDRKGWYFVKPDGAKATGWYQVMWIDVNKEGQFNGWDADGNQRTDRTMKNGTKYWYYFNASGYMVADQWVGDYYVAPDGVMLTATWIKNANGTYSYVDQNGKYIAGYGGQASTSAYLERGILDSASGRYYILINGSRQYLKNEWVAGQYYNANGYLLKSQWVGDYYVDADGNLVKATTDTAVYYQGYDLVTGVDTSYPVSKVAGYYVDKNGKALKSTWVADTNGDWYYIGSNYKLATNTWVDNTYYVGGTGAMLKDTWVGDYFVGHDGKWVK